MSDHCVFGITGWKNSGKTTLVAALVAEFTARGLQVSTVKHAHHNFEIDQEGRDSWKHRKAGAKETALVSSRRWALMHELKEEEEPSLEQMLDKLAPCDLVLVEGFKRAGHPKIETIRNEESGRSKQAPVWQDNDTVVAIATPDPDANCSLPQFHLDAISEIAEFILDYLSITSGRRLTGNTAQSNAR